MRNMEAFMDKVIADADLEFAQYWVKSGSRVKMSDKSEYIVAVTILGDTLSKQFSDGKIWKLFSLVHIRSGVNYATPVPAMAEGRVDIRKLMQAGKYPIISVTHDHGTEKKRVYTVEDESGYVNKLTVTY